MKTLAESISGNKHMLKSEAKKLSTVAKRFGNKYLKNTSLNPISIIRYTKENPRGYGYPEEGIGLACQYNKKEECIVVFEVNPRTTNIDKVFITKDMDISSNRIKFFYSGDGWRGSGPYMYELEYPHINGNEKKFVEFILAIFNSNLDPSWHTGSDPEYLKEYKDCYSYALNFKSTLMYTFDYFKL